MTYRSVAVVIAFIAGSASAHAQVSFKATVGGGGRGLTIVQAPAAAEPVPSIPGAPFSADAVTEFTQVLGDGNRIERRYTASLARDSRGRTRREEEVALIGPVALLRSDGAGEPQRFITITDPVEGVTISLDAAARTARSNRLGGNLEALRISVEQLKIRDRELGGGAGRGAGAGAGAGAGRGGTGRQGGPVAETAKTESLGTRTIEGVLAEGTRTTTTITAGAIGNLQPIDIVNERWFSPELQVPVLISRRDPRSGDTVYRLSSIVRLEPPPDLFTVPPGYEVLGTAEGKKGLRLGGPGAPLK